ncbi:MAG: KH domain-containing protein [Acidobacteria bacterium]|nr:KH domain-containing protein [Acidobacteriota bacterium]
MDFEAFLKDVLTPALDHPEELRIEVSGEGRRRDVLIHAAPSDRGRIIGKSGRMISSLRTLCRAAGDKAGIQVELELFDEDERAPREA